VCSRGGDGMRKWGVKSAALCVSGKKTRVRERRGGGLPGEGRRGGLGVWRGVGVVRPRQQVRGLRGTVWGVYVDVEGGGMLNL